MFKRGPRSIGETAMTHAALNGLAAKEQSVKPILGAGHPSATFNT
jgi:hypothetical protein